MVCERKLLPPTLCADELLGTVWEEEPHTRKIASPEIKQQSSFSFTFLYW